MYVSLTGNKTCMFLSQVISEIRRQAVALSPRLDFTEITRNDSGNYSCHAVNYPTLSGRTSPERFVEEAFMYIYVECKS